MGIGNVVRPGDLADPVGGGYIIVCIRGPVRVLAQPVSHLVVGPGKRAERADKISVVFQSALDFFATAKEMVLKV